MSTRSLQPVPAPTSAADVTDFLPALERALDSRGPALLPFATDPAALSDSLLAAARPNVSLERDDVAVVMFTSGSTGTAKAVLLTSSALLAAARAALDRLGGPGQWLLALPVTHVAGLMVLVRSIASAAPPVVLDGPFDPDRLTAATNRLDAGARRYTSLVPTQLTRALRVGGEAVQALATYDAVLLGGSAVPAALVEQAKRTGIRVVTTYGMTETCGGCVFDGQPLDGVSVAIDSDQQDEDNVRRGVIRLRGPMLFAGYRLRVDLWQAARFDGWFVTGDLGRIDGGRLQVLGRIDDVIVTGGMNVSTGVVEAAVSALDAVLDVAVVGRPDDEWGERIVAYVVTANPTLSLGQLREALRSALPPYALPRQLILLDALPTLHGDSSKVDRRALHDATRA
jgi:o-succinylbenzoate---CoA ligase